MLTVAGLSASAEFPIVEPEGVADNLFLLRNDSLITIPYGECRLSVFLLIQRGSKYANLYVLGYSTVTWRLFFIWATTFCS